MVTELFGSRRRSQILLLLALLEESHAHEVARLLSMHVGSAHRILIALEDEGVVVSREVGRERRITFNPRYAGVKELRAFLVRRATSDREVFEAAASLRRRPRKRGKEI